MWVDTKKVVATKDIVPHGVSFVILFLVGETR